MTFIHTVLQEASNGNFSFFVFAAAIVQIVIMCRHERGRQRVSSKEKAMLKKVKSNLILQHDEDDTLLLGFIAAAVSYAEAYQHKPGGHYAKKTMTPTTEQAVIMLSSHFYESRDGSTGGFFADNVNAAGQVWITINRLLALDREVKL